jgi:hypothetical protein
LGLAEFRDYWPFVDWMYRLFSSLLHWLEVGDSSSAFGVHHNQALWTNQLRPENMNLLMQPDLEDSTTEVTHGDNTAMPLPLYEQDASSIANVQPDQGMLQQFMSGILTENFLDPFMPLDNLAWDDPSMAN